MLYKRAICFCSGIRKKQFYHKRKFNDCWMCNKWYYDCYDSFIHQNKKTETFIDRTLQGKMETKLSDRFDFGSSPFL